MITGPYWLLIILGLILGTYGQIKLTATYSKYSRVGVESGLTGAEAARQILDHAALNQVPVEEVAGRLTDHYDPIKKALFLSSENLQGCSIAAVGVATHETRHALQHQAAYALLKLRIVMVPAAQFANYAWIGILFLGMVLGGGFLSKFIWIAVGIFAVITLFQIVTLPVEFDASRRAKEQLLRFRLVRAHESEAVSKVLNAAALTYVAAMVVSVLELLRLLMLARSRDD
jgi:uncharacterized protein